MIAVTSFIHPLPLLAAAGSLATPVRENQLVRDSDVPSLSNPRANPSACRCISSLSAVSQSQTRCRAPLKCAPTAPRTRSEHFVATTHGEKILMSSAVDGELARGAVRHLTRQPHGFRETRRAEGRQSSRPSRDSRCGRGRPGLVYGHAVSDLIGPSTGRTERGR